MKEVFCCRWMDCDGVRSCQSSEQLSHSEEVFKAIKPFQHIEKPVSCILCVSGHKEYKLHLLERQHFTKICHHLQDGVVFILATAVVEDNHKLTSGISIPQDS